MKFATLSQPHAPSQAQPLRAPAPAAPTAAPAAVATQGPVSMLMPALARATATPEPARAVLTRLLPEVDGQLAPFMASLNGHGIDPKQSRLQVVVDLNDARTTGVLDATALALLLAQRAGVAVAVTGTDGTGLGAFGTTPETVLSRLMALCDGTAGALDAETAAWLRQTQAAQRTGAGGGGELAAISAAHKSLKRHQRAEAHDAILVLKSTPSRQQVQVMEASFKSDGIAMHGVAVGAGSTQLQSVTIKPDAQALRRAVGTVLASTLLTSLQAKLVEHIAELTAHRALTADMLKETNRTVADAWFATRTQEFVGHAVTVQERLVRSDPLVFDLSGRGMSGLELVELKPGDGLLLDREQKTTTKSRDLGEVDRRPNRWTIDTYARTAVTTTDHVRETRFAQWVGKNTGVLVMDHGQGFDKTALFGDKATTGRDVADGFADLARLDKNGDGVVDKNDPDFHKLRIWRDRSGTGQVRPEDIMTLEEAGIAEIRVTWTNTDDAVFAQQGTWVSTRGVELRDAVQQAPAHVQHATNVELVLRDTAGTAMTVVGGYLAGPAALDDEIAKQQRALDAVVAELRQLQQ